jgi:hypothetical protein
MSREIEWSEYRANFGDAALPLRDSLRCKMPGKMLLKGKWRLVAHAKAESADCIRP